MMTHPWFRMPLRARKSIAIGAIIVFSIFVLDFMSVVVFSLIQPAIPSHVDAVVVLGAKVGTPALTQRTLMGLTYYEQGKTDTIVLSGAKGQDESTSEAQAMETIIKAELTKTHSKMPQLILDTKSSDTIQNLTDTRSLIPHAKSIIVVSDCFHLERSVLIAKHVGFQHVYWGAPAPTYYNGFDLTRYYVREAIAIVVQLPKLV